MQERSGRSRSWHTPALAQAVQRRVSVSAATASIARCNLSAALISDVGCVVVLVSVRDFVVGGALESGGARWLLRFRIELSDEGGSCVQVVPATDIGARPTQCMHPAEATTRAGLARYLPLNLPHACRCCCESA